MYEMLIEIGYDIIREEKLPIPKEIKLINTVLGTRRTKGNCTRHKITDEFKIRVNIRTAAFIPNPLGKYICRKTGERVERIMGKIMSLNEIKDTLAHEIAHLKYWNHDAQHTSYTKHILDRINTRLECHLKNII